MSSVISRSRSAAPGLLAPLRFAAMAGSSIASPAAAAWVTDLLNAAYFARPPAERDVADLRLAAGIITTRWASLGGRRLGGGDVLALNRAYGRRRIAARGRLDRKGLIAGARPLLGEWFTEAWADSARRAHGIAFPTVAARNAFAPERRLAHAALGPLTPPRLPPERRHWSTYDPVALPDPDAALELLQDPGSWPDFASAAGRFTALRSTGLFGQTFEIEVVAHPTPRTPVFTRGYVTCTAFAGPGSEELSSRVDELTDHFCSSSASRSAHEVLPTGAEPLALAILTTHDGHFLGRALSHLLVWRDERGSWIRDVGAWDPLPVHLGAAYKLAGRAAQHAFWGPLPPARSMLAQLAAVSAQRGSNATPLRASAGEDRRSVSGEGTTAR